MTFTDLQNTMSRFSAENVVQQVYDNTKELLVDLNTDQLMHGQTVQGGSYRPYKLENYADFKNQLNPLPGHGNPDLRLTGQFHRSITATVIGGKIEINSNLNDEKVSKLEGWYGPDAIYGLNEQYREIHINENILPELKQVIEDATGLTMQV